MANVLVVGFGNYYLAVSPKAWPYLVQAVCVDQHGYGREATYEVSKYTPELALVDSSRIKPQNLDEPSVRDDFLKDLRKEIDALTALEASVSAGEIVPVPTIEPAPSGKPGHREIDDNIPF